MRKLSLCLVMLVVLSCSGSDDKVKEPTSYSVELTSTCPNLNRSTYCVTKEVHDYVIKTMHDTPNQGCVFIEINTISDGKRKGYILSAGVGCK